MRLHIGEKIREQKAMLISGKKYRPLIEDRVQRMAVYLMIGFSAFMFSMHNYFPCIVFLYYRPCFGSFDGRQNADEQG